MKCKAHLSVNLPDLFFKLSGLSCYLMRLEIPSYVVPIPVFMTLLEDKVGSQGPNPTTEQWRRGMGSMIARGYQEHFYKNWKVFLEAIMLDYDVL